MTKEEFMDHWCAVMAYPLSVFEKGERVAVRCYCGQEGCKGWKALINDPERLREHAETDGSPPIGNEVKWRCFTWHTHAQGVC